MILIILGCHYKNDDEERRVIGERECESQFVNFEVILVKNALCLSLGEKNNEELGWSQRTCVKGSSKEGSHSYMAKNVKSF